MTRRDPRPGEAHGATFDPIAGSYDDLVDSSIAFGGQEHEFFTRRKTDVILDVAQRRLGDPATLSVLDVGCGIGLTDEHLVGRIGDLHGSDPAGDALEVAARRNPDVDYQVSGDTLPYADATFDLVFAICVLHHVELGERPALVDEMRRVVRPGGLVGVFEHNPWNPLTRVAVSRCEFDEDAQLLTRRRTQRLLRDAGLEIVEARYLLFFPFARRWTPTAERALRGVPMGAQHYVIGRRA